MSRAYPSLDSLGAMRLKGACVPSTCLNMDSLDVTGKKASASATGGTNWASRRANTWVHPIDELLKWEKACLYVGI